MTIHHDKMAYGKLKQISGDMSEEEILDLLAKINDDSKSDAERAGDDAGRAAARGTSEASADSEETGSK